MREGGARRWWFGGVALLAFPVWAFACELPAKQVFASALAVPAEQRSRFNLEIPGCRYARTVGRAVELDLDADTPRLHGGIRSEVTWDFPFEEGDEVEYRWKALLSDALPLGDELGRWWLIAQWHDQPDPRRGETWATFPHRSPPVAVAVSRRDGRLGVSLAVSKGRLIGWLPVQEGEWLDFSVRVRWSQAAQGFVALTIGDGVQKLTWSGITMLNGYQHYWKLGQYRHPGIAVRSRITVATLSAKRLN